MCTIYGVLLHFTIFCCQIIFFAIYAVLSRNQFCRDLRVLDVPFSAIHGDEWLFHDYDASAGLPTLAQGCQR